VKEALDPDLVSIVDRAKAGDEAAFSMIYRQFADPLYRYLYARCGDIELAEHLTGDLWVRVVEKLPMFRFPTDGPDAAFAAWLYRIARNLLIDTYRRQSKAPLPLHETISATDAPLDERVMVHETRQELNHAMDQLTPEQREVLLLRFGENYKHAQVADVMGRSEGAVRLLQHRALAALARILGHAHGENEG